MNPFPRILLSPLTKTKERAKKDKNVRKQSPAKQMKEPGF